MPGHRRAAEVLQSSPHSHRAVARPSYPAWPTDPAAGIPQLHQDAAPLQRRAVTRMRQVDHEAPRCATRACDGQCALTDVCISRRRPGHHAGDRSDPAIGRDVLHHARAIANGIARRRRHPEAEDQRCLDNQPHQRDVRHSAAQSPIRHSALKISQSRKAISADPFRAAPPHPPSTGSAPARRPALGTRWQSAPDWPQTRLGLRR
jgi:hypothetical protein